MINLYKLIKESNLEIGDFTNVGIIQDKYKDQYKINGIWYHKSIITSSESNKEESIIDNIINKLEKENGKGFITLYHGTDIDSANKIERTGMFGHDGISFLTKSKKEAKEYSINKAKYRKKKSDKVIELILPKYSIKKNNSTGEYETEYEFEFLNNKWYPTNKSLLKNNT